VSLAWVAPSLVLALQLLLLWVWCSLSSTLFPSPHRECRGHVGTWL
jgi:hypothetical protein